MIRIHGDRLSLLTALTSHWAEQQLSLPAQPTSSPSGGGFSEMVTTSTRPLLLPVARSDSEPVCGRGVNPCRSALCCSGR